MFDPHTGHHVVSLNKTFFLPTILVNIRVNIYFCNHFKGLVVKNSNISNRKVTLINKFVDLSPV